MSITTLKKLHIKPRNLISLEKEVERNLTNTPDLIIIRALEGTHCHKVLESKHERIQSINK